jgi:hypothetical protein
MRRILSIVFVLASLPFNGCTNTIPLGGGKSILCIPFDDSEKFLQKLGYANNHSASISRSTTGDRLFIEFDDHVGRYGPAVRYKVAIVSSNGITVKDLPGQSRLNDEALPVFWAGWGDKSMTPLQFAIGQTLPTNVHTAGWVSDGKFVALFRDFDHWWIAKVVSPLEEIVFDRKPDVEPQANLQLIVTWKDKLHVFVRGAPEGKPRRDRWFILKRYEYLVEGNSARLVRVQDFYDTWTAQDFDPESGLLFASSWDVPFAHGLLINTRTEERKDFRSCRGRGYLVTDAVAKRFRETLEDK